MRFANRLGAKVCRVILRLFALTARFRSPPLGVLILAVALLLQLLPALPTWSQRQWQLALALACLLLCLPLRRSGARLCLWLCVFITSNLLLMQQGLLALAPATVDRVDQVAKVRILGLPIRDEQGWRFSALLLAEPTQTDSAGKLVQVTWSAGYSVASNQALPSDIRPGEIWQLPLRFRNWRSLRNPLASGPPDSRVRAMEDGLWARAQVRLQLGEAVRLAPAMLDCGVWSCVLQLVNSSRYATRAAILAAMRQDYSRISGMLVALVLGDQSLIAAQDWQRFNRTGIGHLISISGLHVTMIAALGAWCFAGSWRLAVRRSRGVARWAERHCSLSLASRSGAVLVGAWYCLFAGAQVPAQRTFWMLLTLACVTALRRRCDLLLSLSTAAVVVLLLDPWAVLSPGFWLSFVATWALMRGMQSAAKNEEASWFGRQWQVVRTATQAQAIVTFGLIPLSASMFGYFSVVSPLANAFAIPLVSYVVTPLAVTGAMLNGLTPGLWSPLSALANGIGNMLWGLAGQSLALMMRALAYLDTQTHLPTVLALAGPATLPGLVSLALAYAGVGMLVMASKWLWRLLGLVLMSLVFVPHHVWPEQWRGRQIQGMEVTVLDLGAGSAVLVRTPDLTILYDTGASASNANALTAGSGQDQASRIILPYLRERGIRHLDLLIVSHADREHVGGLAAFQQALTIKSLILPPQLAQSAGQTKPILCQGHALSTAMTSLDLFQWTSAKNANDASCVLRVQVKTNHATSETLLLLGDLTVAGQKALLNTWSPQMLQASVLQMPGQGGKHTWYPAFLATVSPRDVIVQAQAGHWRGYPLPSATTPLEVSGARLLRTDTDGAITLRLGTKVDGKTLWRERIDAPRYFDDGQRH